MDKDIKRALLAVSVAAATVLTGCGAPDGGDGSSKAAASKAERQNKRVLWMGDSIAGAEAPPLGAALEASGVEFENASSDGGGTVVDSGGVTGAITEATWKELAKDIASFRPDVIAYQVTTYDWGTAGQQRAGYEKLAAVAGKAGAELVIVSAPPFRIDDFYKKYEGAIRSAPKAAEEVADGSGGKVRFVDSAALWGTDPGAGKARRAKDGIHSCQQGSAAFAKWFTERLGAVYGFTPAAPEKWATGSWTGDKRYGSLGCD